MPVRYVPRRAGAGVGTGDDPAVVSDREDGRAHAHLLPPPDRPERDAADGCGGKEDDDDEDEGEEDE